MIQEADLLPLTTAELAELLAQGHPIELAALDDWEYRGVSLGMPRLVERLTWKTFKKVFHRDPARGVLRGWNVRLEQTGVEGPTVPLQKRGQDFTFGHFHVLPGEGFKMPVGPAHAALIHYGVGGNPRLDVTAVLRDPLVALERGDTELLLGVSYVEVLGLTFTTPTYFSLRRERKLAAPVPPPRG